MPTTSLKVRSPKGASKNPKPLTSSLQQGKKILVALKPEEVVLARSLARLIAQPGHTLNAQDVMRIALANLGITHQQSLSEETEGHL